MNRRGLEVIEAQWPAPEGVRALTTTRAGGVSAGPYAALNLGGHVGDDPAAVAENRRRLMSACELSDEPVWLTQTHSARVVDAASVSPNGQADGSFTTQPGIVCCVLTADCLPLFVCNRHGSRVGIVHVGWRGLAAGIVENAVRVFADDRSGVIAWLGPSIGPESFEVGEDVKLVLQSDQSGSEACFTPARRSGKWLADLYCLTRLRLRNAGVVDCFYDNSLCTYKQPERFFSYRRDRECGRMASLIWIDIGRKGRVCNPSQSA